MRKIPATMVTQHPDHANKPYWLDREMILTQDESYESYISFAELGATEYKWDWEGKLVDESVIERLLTQYFEYFKKFPIGKENFLTFRLPNPYVQTEFRLGRAFMVILSASILSKEVGLGAKPLFEVILPMVERAEDLIDIQEAYRELASLKHKLFEFSKSEVKHIEMIPLFEEIDIILDSHNIIKKYLKLHHEKFGFTPNYMRPYVARSDPAMNGGMVPTVLAIKIALSNYKKFAEKTGIKMYPIIGAASLPFRGGINPDTVDNFINEYSGIRTTTLQSSFRYDYEISKVKEAIEKLEIELPKRETRQIDSKEEKRLIEIIHKLSFFYRATIENESIADLINNISSSVPNRRERVQHVGLFGYSRGLGKIKLPRAIKFTGALYSLGIPPEIIGTGRGLKNLEKKSDLELVKKHYINLIYDIQRAGRFVNKEVIMELSKKYKPLKLVIEDIKYLEEILEIDFNPVTKDEKEHYELVNLIAKRLMYSDDPSELVEKASKLRKSVG